MQRDDFSSFTQAVARRLEAGAREYGDASFSRPPAELVGEVLEELEDVAGWAYVAWCRVRDLEGRLPPADRAPGAIHETTPAETASVRRDTGG